MGLLVMTTRFPDAIEIKGTAQWMPNELHWLHIDRSDRTSSWGSLAELIYYFFPVAPIRDNRFITVKVYSSEEWAVLDTANEDEWWRCASQSDALRIRNKLLARNGKPIEALVETVQPDTWASW